MITVVGVTGSSSQVDLPQDCPNASIVCRSSNHTFGLPIQECYDQLFEGEDLESAPREITRDIISRSLAGDVLFIVPGRGDVGDSTVETLAACVDIQIHPGVLPFPPVGRLQIVDASTLAAAEQQSPFDTGLLAIDPEMPLLVTNWIGSLVPKLASNRISRLYGPCWTGQSLNNTELFVSPLAIENPSASPTHLASLASFLRTPEGCPWDREQSIESLMPSLLEEVSEFEESVQSNDQRNQAEELGDVLMNVLMIAQIAHEEGRFSLDDVVFSISEKIIRRHPHVFGNEESGSVEDVRTIWQRIKDEEQQKT